MAKQDLCAYTEAGTIPAYINFSKDDDGSYIVTVRGSGEQTGQSIKIPAPRMSTISHRLRCEFLAEDPV